jgi:hypothetical protein
MIDSSARREARLLQRLIASVFIGLGGWCLVAPGSVISLIVLPEQQAHTTLVLVSIGAFGAQACLAGLFAAFSVFTKQTFLAFAIALLPFFVFDWWFYAVHPLYNELILIDVFGNVIMLALCWRGYKLLSGEATVTE